MRSNKPGWNKAKKEMKEILGEGFFEDRKPTNSLVLSTGIPRLDAALCGGLHCGVTEIFGAESVGKTLLLGHILASAQGHGKRTALGATEYLDLPYLKALEVDLDKLVVIRGRDPANFIEAVLDFARAENSVAAIDSISAIQASDGLYAGWFFAADQLLAGSVSIHPTSCIVVTSQVRQQKSAIPGRKFRKRTISASRLVAKEFVTRLELSREDVSEDDYDMVVQVVTHPAAGPGGFIDFPVEKGHPIDIGVDLLRLGLENGTVQQRGSFYYVGDVVLGQGLDVSGGVLLTNQELTDAVLSGCKFRGLGADFVTIDETY